MTKQVYKYPYNGRTEDEIKIFLSDQICEQVVKITYRNGQIFCTIKDRITSKKKEIILSATIIFGVLFVMPKEARPIGVSVRLPSAPEINRPATQHFHQHAPTVNPRVDKIRFVKPSELPLWVYMMDEQVIKTPEISKLIKKLRGGNLIETAGVLILIVVMWQIMGVGIEGFQLPIVHPNGGVHRPANGGIEQYINHPKHGGRIRVRMSESNQCPAHQTQVSGFVKNGKVDLCKCYDEVMRRSKSLDCDNWSCEFERFKSLAMENGRVDENSAREAITVLHGEMLGFYKNSERVYYGNGVNGPDFKVIGQVEYSHVTHVEVKNPVGSDIEKASRNGYSDIVNQGNKIGDKLSKQQSKWSNATFRASLRNLDPHVAFPQSPANTLGLVDEFDVPISEKMIVQNAVENNCTNTSNVIFINNQTNI